MKRPQGAVPTLAQLQASIGWFWLWCERCQHSAPIKFAPLVARWGADTSSDKLRRCARCTVCGQKGATLQHPSWMGSDVGFQAFPADELNVARNQTVIGVAPFRTKRVAN